MTKIKSDIVLSDNSEKLKVSERLWKSSKYNRRFLNKLLKCKGQFETINWQFYTILVFTIYSYFCCLFSSFFSLFIHSASDDKKIISNILVHFHQNETEPEDTVRNTIKNGTLSGISVDPAFFAVFCKFFHDLILKIWFYGRFNIPLPSRIFTVFGAWAAVLLSTLLWIKPWRDQFFRTRYLDVSRRQSKGLISAITISISFVLKQSPLLFVLGE